ncbi:HpcH HpaI aldolase family [Carnimonas sp. R-84981]|uniref:hypothetical protein n=1 Tax=Carnimonas bestiolae TaxID=3402172 RepID=UPI003EDB6E1A
MAISTLGKRVTLDALAKSAPSAEPCILDLSEEVAGYREINAAVEAWHANATAPLKVRTHHAAHLRFYDDLRFCRATAAVDTLLLSACESANTVELAAMSGCAIWPLISTAKGVLSIDSIAAAKGVTRLIICETSLSQALGLKSGSEGEQRGLDVWRARMVAVSCAHGLAAPVLWTPCVRDGRSIEQQLQLADEMGFGGQIAE